MNDIHNVLWTSGWDSTYRVLELLLLEKQSVQPYYVVDHRRLSTSREIRAMDEIRRALEKHDEAAYKRLAPPILIQRSSILPNEQITRTYEALRTQGHFGDQYDWLTRMAHQHDIRKLELCVHSVDKFADFSKDPIFSVFSFPSLGLTKLDMRKRASEGGFLPLMEMTWFCHWPIRDKPCGYCNPCRYTREEGLDYRLPPQTWLREKEFRLRKWMRRMIATWSSRWKRFLCIFFSKPRVER
jgi:hypothetical protein